MKEEIVNKHYVSVVINTKGKGIPIYLQDFVAESIRSTGCIFSLDKVFNISDTWKTWKAKKSDTIFQYVFSMNTELDEGDFKTYTSAIIMEEILPFITGCKFDMLGVKYEIKISNECLD